MKLSSSRARRAGGRSAVPILGGALAVACALAVLPGSASTAGVPPIARAAAPCDGTTARPLQMAEANLKMGTPIGDLKQDLRKVYRSGPDFVAFNEVPKRQDSVLAPDGYALWRTPGFYTGANPVTWRTDRWTPVARGTINVSNKQGYNPGQHVMWGVRYANWVTLESTTTCQRVSVVAYHVAPKSKITMNLLAPSVRRLGKLTAFLAAEGPVLLAGDLNRHYKSGEYPRKLLTEMGMVPTYDLAGEYFPTGDHQGATIDYVFLNEASRFQVVDQRTKELNSDHDALIVDLSLASTPARPTMSPTWAQGDVVNVPVSTDREAQRAVLRQMVRAVRFAPKGAVVRIATGSLDMGRLMRALRAAHRRGVQVRFVTGNATYSAKELALKEELGSDRSRTSYVLSRPKAWGKFALPPTTLLVSTSGTSTRVRLDSNQRSTKEGATYLTRAKVTTTRRSYEGMMATFDGIH